ncbi:MAG TPA: hypothetical protein VJW76_08495 [Verrucomicrobiae bacterium]|nr:hypothetical protein [Verrucomicrobiae bacterium]
MKNSSVLLPVVIATLTGVTLLLSARHGNTHAADSPAAPPIPVSLPEDSVIGATGQQRAEAAGPAATAKPNKLSYGLDEIAKMVEAGVPPEVVEAFIDNSTIAYAPNAEDVVQLHKLGASSRVVAAVIRHGGRLREQGIREFKESQATLSQPAQRTAVTPAVYAPVAAPSVQPESITYNNYAYAYPAVVGPGYSIQGYAGLRRLCYPRPNYWYPRYSFPRHYFPTRYSSFRPYATYNYCAPRHARFGVSAGFGRCRPGADLRVGLRR